MSVQTKLLTVAVLSMMTTYAAAESEITERARTRIDFNKMIATNNVDKQDLQNKVNGQVTADQQQQHQSAENKKVMDFVDVEIGIGRARPVVVDRPTVDRRFNSSSEPKLVDVRKFQLRNSDQDSGT
jgi:hypothetical protein